MEGFLDCQVQCKANGSISLRSSEDWALMRHTLHNMYIPPPPVPPRPYCCCCVGKKVFLSAALLWSRSRFDTLVIISCVFSTSFLHTVKANGRRVGGGLSLLLSVDVKARGWQWESNQRLREAGRSPFKLLSIELRRANLLTCWKRVHQQGEYSLRVSVYTCLRSIHNL